MVCDHNSSSEMRTVTIILLNILSDNAHGNLDPEKYFSVILGMKNERPSSRLESESLNLVDFHKYY